MPKFLNEHQVGFDTNWIGFPNLGGCLAVVLQDEGGLFGFHITPGNARQSGEFARFIQSSVGLRGRFSHLYGSCYRANRYHGGDAQAKWQAEMSEIAKAVGYRGIVSGFDTSAKSAKITSGETTYLEYRLGGDNQCAIYFKRMSKMDLTDTTGTAADPTIQRIIVDKAHTVEAAKPVFQLTDPYKFKTTTDAKIKATKSNKGELHLVKPSAIESFNCS